MFAVVSRLPFHTTPTKTCDFLNFIHQSRSPTSPHLTLCPSRTLEHLTWVYKHWKCITAHELGGAANAHQLDDLDGIDSLPETYRKVVLDSFEKGEVLEPPEPEEPASKTTKPRKSRKSNVEAKKKAVHDADEAIKSSINDIAPGPETTAKIMEQADPAASKNTALPDAMRKRAGQV